MGYSHGDGAGGVSDDYVRDIFTRIATRYDLMNSLMTARQDHRWRREVIQRASLPPHAFLLDIGAGTGDLAHEALRQHPDCHPLASDFTLAMMRVGKRRPRASTPQDWAGADALQLPFASNSFDAVVSGFLLRNIVDLMRGLGEQFRVLKPGGWVVALDSTRPKHNLLYPFVHFYMHQIIPNLGWLVTRQRDAYTYLPDSTEKFLRAEDLLIYLAAAGFRNVGFHRRLFGVIAIHWGQKPL